MESMNGRRPKRHPGGPRPGKPAAERAPEESGFARPFVTVDVAVLALRPPLPVGPRASRPPYGHEREDAGETPALPAGEGKGRGLAVLLMKRGSEPFRDRWALPGGYIHSHEDVDLEAAARRILREKAGVETPYVEQLQGFGSEHRDPRGWSVTFAYFALIAADGLTIRHGANAADVAWWEIEGTRVRTELAFDHADILACAVRRLRNKVEYTSLPVHLLPEKFTLPDLQRVYEQILDRRMDKSAFRKRIAEANFLEPISGEKRLASNRPAQMYRIKPGCATIFFDRTI
jgi:ADP-ribose pyrophosphatase YjhB (NUDIX family)